MSADKLNIAYEGFDISIKEVFKELLIDHEFADVTLACEDDKQIKAHKAILTLCSSFFKRILKKNPHNHPLIYMRGITFANLQAIIEFIYLGQVHITQENLGSFMKEAEELEVKGLTNDVDSCEPFLDVDEVSNTQTKVDTILEQTNDGVKNESEDNVPQFNEVPQANPTTSDHKGIHKVDEKYRYPCSQCDYRSTKWANLQIHVKSRHEGIKFVCTYCEFKFSTKSNLAKHVRNKHK